MPLPLLGALALGGLGSVIGAGIQSSAAKSAAQTQADAATQAAQLQAQATEQQRADLQPFAQFGLGAIPQFQQAQQQQQALFGPDAGQAIMQNPMFQALQNQAQTNIMQNAAVAGRLGTGGTQQHLQDAALRTGFDVLNQERQAALANTQSLLSPITLGQNAAAGQAATLGQGAQIQGGLLTDAAASTSAGTIGAANAFSGGLQNLTSLGMTGALLGTPSVGAGLGTPNIGGGGTLQGGATINPFG